MNVKGWVCIGDTLTTKFCKVDVQCRQGCHILEKNPWISCWSLKSFKGPWILGKILEWKFVLVNLNPDSKSQFIYWYCYSNLSILSMEFRGNPGRFEWFTPLWGNLTLSNPNLSMEKLIPTGNNWYTIDSMNPASRMSKGLLVSTSNLASRRRRYWLVKHSQKIGFERRPLLMHEAGFMDSMVYHLFTFMRNYIFPYKF